MKSGAALKMVPGPQARDADADAITIEVLKNKVKQLYNSEHQSSIHKALSAARARSEEMLRKQQLAEMRNAELSKHNQELEAKIKERTRAIRLLLDNAGQGFFTVDAAGLVGSEYSLAVEALFGMKPAGKHLAELLGQDLAEWSASVRTLFSEKIPFEDYVGILPSDVHKNGKIIQMVYRAIRGEKREITHVMVIATDVTEMRALAERSEKERQTNKMLVKILRSRNDFITLLEMIDGFDAESASEHEAKRALHTLKGSFGFLECKEFATFCHQWEDRLKSRYSPALFAQAIREIQGKVDGFLSAHDEVLNLKSDRSPSVRIRTNTLHQLIRKAYRAKVPPSILSSLEELAEAPAREVLGWLSDAFVLTAQRLQKNAAPIEWLPSASIRPDLYTDLFKSLIHIAQNAADHGIEPEEVRARLGKPPQGRMLMRLERTGDEYRLMFKDDGAGLNFEKIKAKAREKGLPDPKIEDDFKRLLLSGDFSTKDQVTETSGRGVGLEAVDQAARKHGGFVELQSEPGKGTQVTVVFKRKTGPLEYSSESSLLHLMQRKELLNVILSGIHETLKGHANTHAVPGVVTYRDRFAQSGVKLAGAIKLSGRELDTTLLLGFTEEVFLKIYENMFQSAAEAVSDENQDLAGELLNIAFGIMEPRLREMGYELRPSFPVVLRNQALAEKLSGAKGVISVPYTMSKGTFYLEIFSTDEWED